MRNKLIAFFLPLVFTAKAFSAPAGSACDWVDQEALAALGLTNALSNESPIGTGVQGATQCTIAARDVPVPSLIVSLQTVNNGIEVKPVCNWQPPIQSAHAQIGVCYMSVGNTSLVFTSIVAPPFTSAMQSTLAGQVERLFNKHQGAASQ